MKKAILVFILSIIVLFLSGCIQSGSNTVRDNLAANDSGIGSDIKIPEFETTQELKKFSSAKELQEFLKANAAQQGGGVYGGYFTGVGRGDMVTGVIPPMPMVVATSAEVVQKLRHRRPFQRRPPFREHPTIQKRMSR
ncbi:hypothetical protein [Candidatus Methanoperedens nitratireducens]|uniref:Lipoprotein n=1 Tax=Candidatus Methanoperedens nitratireducens TaxID=1392998 RepID=A0A284VT99_9EURY|nr:hypothetical protein [Candidatus Methanoperedens nitroreducens]SNQ62492.1 exported hypothetical protein [Candidatus Methanoperedens nitroreducens]